MWQLASALGLIRFLPFIAAQAPERDRAEHARVAQWVLDNLINVGSAERGFRALHGTFGESGSYERRVFDFKLLVELVSPEGEIYLRASDEAINVLVGALDTDVESAQIAAEVNQYAETLWRKLDATRRRFSPSTCLSGALHGFPAANAATTTHAGDAFLADGILGS